MGVNITRAQGQLNRTTPTEDAVICIVFSGTAVADKIALGEPKQIFSTDDLTALGITADNNPVAYRDITDFYGLAGEGAELNFVLISNAVTLEDICDVTKAYAKTLLDFTQGRGVVLLVNKDFAEGYTPTITNGLDEDVWNALAKCDTMAKQYQTDNVPFVAVLPAFSFAPANVSELPLRSTLGFDNVSTTAFCEKADGHISIGVIAAWVANLQVSQNIGRVLSGAVTQTGYFPDGTECGTQKARYTAISNTGLIFPIKITGKSGCYFNDDPTMTANTSDYSSISWNRTMNKAQRGAYSVLIEKKNMDVELDATTGKIESSLLSDWESDVENEIIGDMVNVAVNKEKEISGVKCTIDPDSDINNDEIDATISIVRNGQVKDINVSIGYVQSLS